MGTLTIKNIVSTYESYRVSENEINDYLATWAKGYWAARWQPNPGELGKEQFFGMDWKTVLELEHEMRAQTVRDYPKRWTSPVDAVIYKYNEETDEIERHYAG